MTPSRLHRLTTGIALFTLAVTASAATPREMRTPPPSESPRLPGAGARVATHQDSAALAGPDAGVPFPMWLSPGLGPELRAKLMRAFMNKAQVWEVLRGLEGTSALTRQQIAAMEAAERAFNQELREVRKLDAPVLQPLQRERRELNQRNDAGTAAERAARADRIAELDGAMRAIRLRWPKPLDLYRRWWLLLTPEQALVARARLREAERTGWLTPRTRQMSDEAKDIITGSTGMHASSMTMMSEMDAGGMRLNNERAFVRSNPNNNHTSSLLRTEYPGPFAPPSMDSVKVPPPAPRDLGS